MFARFWSDQRGTIAATFGYMIIPIVGVTGIALDYGRATVTRTSLQNAIDATGLILSQDIKLNPAMDAATVQSKGQQYFDSQFKPRFSKNVSVTTAYTPPSAATNGLSKITIGAKADVATTISNVMGVDTLSVASNAEVVWGIKRLELALALDNTGSMSSSNKIVELKTAVRSLLNTLYKAAQKDGDIKVAIIPFATDVNIGTTNVNATWLDWSQWDNDNRVCTRTDSNGNCTRTAAANHNTWNGCVWDRSQNYDTNDTPPTNLATQFQPHQAGNCPVSMIGLTDIKSSNAWSTSDLNNTTSPSSTLGKKVNSMAPNGNTNVTIGMVWGYHAVTSATPLTEAGAPKDDLDKVIILLTDGDNTQNRWSTNNTTIDARTALACTEAKNAGIKIYTIRVIDGDADLLRACATSPSMYYDVQNAAQLNVVFTSIAQNLANLRLSK